MNDITEKYIVVYYYNNKEHIEEYPTSLKAWDRKVELVKEGYEPHDVSIHLKQLNKFGDCVVI